MGGMSPLCIPEKAETGETYYMHNKLTASYWHRFVESTKACTFKLKEAAVFLWKYTFIPSLERKAGAGKRNNV